MILEGWAITSEFAGLEEIFEMKSELIKRLVGITLYSGAEFDSEFASELYIKTIPLDEFLRRPFMACFFKDKGVESKRMVKGFSVVIKTEFRDSYEVAE